MKVCFISLGCDKNLVDTEYMLGILRAHGMIFTDEPASAEVIVVNTCSFIHDAMQESIDTILEMAQYKEQNCRALLVAGCLGTRFAQEMHRELPEVDAIVSATGYDRIFAAIESVLAGQPEDQIADVNALPLPDVDRIVTTGGHYAYVKIAEGCSKHCTYCVIPSIRGSYRSLPMERILYEAEMLVRNGASELILVAQETTVYGTDLYGRKALPELLTKLCRIPEFRWIRLLYCYPEEITDELIAVMRTEPKICHYIDMPIQHASDAVLKRMGRRTNRAYLTELIAKLRAEIPDICIRTTLISGFPGETEEDHEILLDFVEQMEFERLGVFSYSREEGTPAYEMEEQVEEAVANRRRDEIMELQQEIAFAHAEDLIGKKMTVFVEGRLAEDDVYVTRTYLDAPGVDGNLFLHTERELLSGTFVEVIVTGANEYDLIGELTDESAE